MVGADQGAAGMGLVMRGVGIGRQGDCQAQARGAARGGVDAILSGVAAHHQVPNAACGQPIGQAGAQEGIWRGLSDEHVLRLGASRGMHRPACAAVGLGVVGARVFMLIPQHRQCGRTGRPNQLVDSLQHLVGLMRARRRFEQGPLHINHDQGGVGHGVSSGVR